jgi:quercetin dioxygenase-like cupin family protein
MEEQIKQIAERLCGMREVLEITIEEAAATCGVTQKQYLEFESGQVDIPVSILFRMAHRYKFDLTALLSGEEPLMHYYTLTRKNKGISVDRQKAYIYQALAGNFKNRKCEPFLVTVEPHENQNVVFNSHPGQEFNYMICGRMKFVIGTKEMILETGDSIYFNSELKHGMVAMDNQPAIFLAIIL